MVERPASGQTPDGTPVLGWWNGRRPAKFRTQHTTMSGVWPDAGRSTSQGPGYRPGFGRTPAVPPPRDRGTVRGLAGRRLFRYPRGENGGELNRPETVTEKAYSTHLCSTGRAGIHTVSLRIKVPQSCVRLSQDLNQSGAQSPRGSRDLSATVARFLRETLDWAVIEDGKEVGRREGQGTVTVSSPYRPP